MIQRLRDRVVLMEIDAIERGRWLGQRVRAQALRTIADEKGQTPTEYLMIVGLMAAVVVLVFATWYWDNVKQAAQDWSKKVKETVMGDKIK